MDFSNFKLCWFPAQKTDRNHKKSFQVKGCVLVSISLFIVCLSSDFLWRKAKSKAHWRCTIKTDFWQGVFFVVAFLMLCTSIMYTTSRLHSFFFNFSPLSFMIRGKKLANMVFQWNQRLSLNSWSRRLFFSSHSSTIGKTRLKAKNRNLK